MNSTQWRSYWQENVAEVGGWLNEWEGRELYEHARQMASNGPMAELGCYQGRSTLCLAKAIRETGMDSGGPRLFSVDLFEETYTFDECDAPSPTLPAITGNLSRTGLRESVQLIRGDTRDPEQMAAVPDGLALLFVDADHVYESLVREWALWSSKLLPGATVIFHDYGNAVVGDGVTRLCDGLRSLFVHVRVCDRFKREPEAQPGGMFIGTGFGRTFPAAP